jgi:hypothetical protein
MVQNSGYIEMKRLCLTSLQNWVTTYLKNHVPTMHSKQVMHHRRHHELEHQQLR